MFQRLVKFLQNPCNVGTEVPILQMSKLRFGAVSRFAQIAQGLKGRIGDEAASWWGLMGRSAINELQSHLTCHFGASCFLWGTGRDREDLFSPHTQSPPSGGATSFCSQHLTFPLEFLEISLLNSHHGSQHGGGDV